MILSYLLLISGLSISAIAEYYSIMGLMAIFSASPIPIAVMGISLGVAKLVMASWVKQYWARIPSGMKAYGVTAVVILMLITTIGCFGFLSKAHNDQNLVSGDVGAKLAIYDEKIKTARDNIEADRKQLKQMDEAVDQVMSRSTSETGADKAVAIRRGQAKDRAALARDIEANQKIISTLNDEAAPIRAENRKVEAEVGPIKYIAAFIYGVAPDASMLEKAVTWIIIMIVVVFDPLAVIMLLAAQMTFGWNRGEEPKPIKPKGPGLVDTLRNRFKKKTALVVDDVSEDIPVFDRQEPEFHAIDVEPDYTDYSEGALVATQDPAPVHIEDPEPEEELPVVEPKKRFVGFAFPMSSIFSKPKEEPAPEVKEELVVETTNPNAPDLDASDERPGDYIKKEEQAAVVKDPRLLEAAPGPNRGIDTASNLPATGVRRKYVPLAVPADNAPKLGKASNSGFGAEFPTNAEKGDVYLRTDYLPNRLFKFNAQKWIEVDKNSTDVYAYDELYIKHLISEIDAGRYDPESLSDVEREQIKQYIGRNAQ